MEHKAFDKERMSRFWGKVKTYVANAISGLYTKPSGGIPKTDLSESVQTSLGKADTAIQSHQDLSGKQDVINDLQTIRDGAALGATALQIHQQLKTIGGNTITGSGNIAWPSYTANDVGAVPSSTLTGYAEEQFVFTLADDSTVTKTFLVK